MATLDDDLDYNPFYRVLQTRFNVAYQNAQDKCYMICVPHSSTVLDEDLTQRYIEMHILRPSPYFQGQYLTTDRGNTGTLLFESGYLITHEGFKQRRKIKIIGEEIGYNSEYKSYKILQIDQPIWSASGSEQISRRIFQAQRKKSAAPDCLAVKIGFDENKIFLNSFKEHKQALSGLDDRILQFNQNYLILKGYLEDAAKRLETIWAEATANVTAANTDPLKFTDSRFQETLSVATESYLLGHVHQKVFPVLRDACRNDDLVISAKLHQLSGMTGEELGLEKDLCYPMPAATIEFSKLDGLTTPLEKLACLKSTLDVITECVNSNVLKKQVWTDKDPPCLTSDELIPLLVIVMSQCTSQHLHSNIYYIENFHWSMSSKDDLSYSFVTFKASVEYVKNTDFSHIISSTRREKSAKKVTGQSRTVANGNQADKKPQRISSFDRQLDHITHMMNISTKDFSTARKQTAPTKGIFEASPSSYRASDVIPGPSEGKPQLGDFLSSLKDDVMHSSYGKQS